MTDLTKKAAPGFWRMLWKTSGAVPLFLAVFTVILSVISLSSMRDGFAFASRGVEVIGQVTDREERRVQREKQQDTDYYLTIRYQGPDDAIELQRKVRRSIYVASDVGSMRPVRYLPENPKKVEFEIGRTLASGQVLRWVSLLFGILTLAALWWKGGRAVDAIRARKFGTAELVTVTGLRERENKNGTSYQMVWADKDGHEGESLTSSNRARFADCPPGAKIEIFRGAKGHMWWVGDVGPRAATHSVPSAG